MGNSILIVSQAMELGGVERSLLGLLDAIDYERYDVDLFLMRHTGELPALSERQSQPSAGDSAVCVVGCADGVAPQNRAARRAWRAAAGKACGAAF